MKIPFLYFVDELELPNVVYEILKVQKLSKGMPN